MAGWGTALPLLVKQPGALPVGDTLAVVLPAAHIHVFDAETGIRRDAA